MVLQALLFKSEIGGVSTVGISLPNLGVPTVCSARAVSGVLYYSLVLNTGYTQHDRVGLL